ncbi:hypothetical protein KFE98_15230 [bacterium SCSIO 12741]|nr:hypothetical protein KFE98_15230 [bacterium SCSIO 12741]
MSYTEFAQDLYAMIYPEDYKKQYDKKLGGLSKQLKLSKLDTREKVRRMENYVKNSFQMLDQNSAELADIDNILNDRICSNLGLLRLYSYWFDLEGIPFELGITSQRDERRFEKDFETYSCLDDYFFYFPELDAYIAYEYPGYRLGSKPPGWENNYGLFIKPITIGNFTTGLAQVKWIAPSPAKKNQDDLQVEVQLGSDLSAPQVIFSRTMSGQNAIFFQPAYESLPPDDQQQVANALIKFINDEEEVEQFEILNTAQEDIGTKPFLIKGTLNYPNLLQQAGNKYLVKIGKVIGPQSELYQEEQRTLGVENDYNRTYLRQIVFHIPEGYRVKNPEAVEFNEVIEKDGKSIMQFVSKYRLEGNDLIIDIDEFYDQIELPREDFESFKAVINAAADFNKVVLILEQM